jgi:hypothetical protein
MPAMGEMVDAAQENVKKWEAYEETEQDKEVYKVV